MSDRVRRWVGRAPAPPGLAAPPGPGPHDERHDEGTAQDVDRWARELAAQIKAHLQDDGAMLPSFGDLATLADDERVRYVVHLILEDAVRHQRMLQEMVNWLLAESEHRPIAGPRVPDHTAARAAVQNRGRAIALAGELLEAGRRHDKELRGLRQQVERVEDTAWWGVLLAAMEVDTRKHLTLLEYVRRALAR